MKTTVEIADSLLAAARRLAAKEGTSVRALIEEGLRKWSISGCAGERSRYAACHSAAKACLQICPTRTGKRFGIASTKIGAAGNAPVA